MWPFGFWNKYPYTNFHEMNDDWVLCKIRQLDAAMHAFVKNWSSPVLAYSYVDFVDKKLIYLYVGDEVGYNQNHWYYWDKISNSWKDGGLYGASDFTEEDIISQLPEEIGYNFRRVDRQFIVNDGTNACNQHGGTVISDNEVVYALLDPDYLNNNVAHIISHNINTHTYTEKGQLVIGHCDSMAYDRAGNKLYIAPAYKAINGVDTQDGTIYVYDYSTLTLLETIPGVNANSVAYDNDNNIMYYTTFLNEWKTADGETVFTFDSTWTSSRQGMFCYDGGFYLVTALPNNIRQFDATGKVIRDIPLREVYDWYIVGEMQWAGVIGDRLILGSTISCEDDSERYPSIWETNLKTNTPPVFHDHNYARLMIASHVDINSTSYNPNGSTGHKFKSINEAMLYASVRSTIHDLYLYDGTYTGMINLNMTIIGNGSSILEPTFKSCVARIVGCAAVNNAAILDGCYVESKLVFTPQQGIYYLTKAYTETRVPDTGWTWTTSSNYVRDHSVFLKLEMTHNNNPPATWTTIATGYPTPKQNWYKIAVDQMGHVYKLRMNTSGELAINNRSGENLNIDDTFIYPLS